MYILSHLSLEADVTEEMQCRDTTEGFLIILRRSKVHYVFRKCSLCTTQEFFSSPLSRFCTQRISFLRHRMTASPVKNTSVPHPHHKLPHLPSLAVHWDDRRFGFSQNAPPIIAAVVLKASGCPLIGRGAALSLIEHRQPSIKREARFYFWPASGTAAAKLCHFVKLICFF